MSGNGMTGPLHRVLSPGPTYPPALITASYSLTTKVPKDTIKLILFPPTEACKLLIFMV